MVDANNGYVALAASVSDGTALPLKIDPLSGRLLVSICKTTEAAHLDNGASTDSNNEGVSMAYDGASLKPLSIDPRNGGLWVDIA